MSHEVQSLEALLGKNFLMKGKAHKKSSVLGLTCPPFIPAVDAGLVYESWGAIATLEPQGEGQDNQRDGNSGH